MKNPVFLGSWVGQPERVTALAREEVDRAELAVGVRTVAQNRDGLKLVPHLAVVIEISGGGDVATMDLTPALARRYAERLNEFADQVEAVNETKARVRAEMEKLIEGAKRKKQK